VPCEGAWKRAALAISRAFWREGFPPGSEVRSLDSAEMCWIGLPDMSEMRIARPSRIPMRPSWEMGFCSKNSVMKEEA
jgi:hypothetical protein